MTTIPLSRPGVAIRPLALPVEHGGWGMLLEPVLIGLIAAGSNAGIWIAIAAAGGFLARHPLKLALQDLIRGRSFPRTPYCWLLSAAYLAIAAGALFVAVALKSIWIVYPLALAAPLAVVQIWFDATNRSRQLIPELFGAVALCSVTASIAIAGNADVKAALTLTGLAIGRVLPAVVYVRALLGRESRTAALALHGVAVIGSLLAGSFAAVAAMVMLFARAIWGFTHDVPPARTIGWREVLFGLVTVVLIGAGSRIR